MRSEAGSKSPQMIALLKVRPDQLTALDLPTLKIPDSKIQTFSRAVKVEKG